MSEPTTFRGRILHSLDVYLRLSENWIYPQIAKLTRYRSVVLADGLQNLELFPVVGFQLRRRHSHWRHIPKIGRIIQKIEKIALRGLYRSPNRRGIVLMHSHFGPRAVRDRRLGICCNVPQIVSFYGADLTVYPRQSKWLAEYKKLLEDAQGFIVEGPYMAETLADLGCPREKIYVRPHGVDLSIFKYVPRIPTNNGRVRLLIAGRFVEKKGLDTAIQAAALAAKDYDGLEVTLIGEAVGNDDQEVVKKIDCVLASSQLRNKVVRLPFLRLPEFLNLACEHDIFVQASRHARNGDSEGGAPVILLQLAATGMPIVSTKHCDIPQCVVHEKTGLLAEENDVLGLANHILTLAKNPEYRLQLGAAARRHVEINFDERRAIEQLEDIYDDVIKKSLAKHH